MAKGRNIVLGPGIHTSKDGKIYDLKFRPEAKNAIALGPLPEIGESVSDIAFEVDAESEDEAKKRLIQKIESGQFD